MRQNFRHFRGMMPILPTVITEDGKPDLKAQERLVEYLLDCGAVAIGHMGAASEYYKISEYDREPILRSLIEQVNGRVPVFVGPADISWNTSMKRAEDAYKYGADMLMVCSPVSGQAQRDELISYYEEIGRRTPLPIIVQDTGASSSLYTAEFVAELYERVETVGYVKAEGQGWFTKSVKLIRTLGDRVQVIGGNGGNGMFPLLRAGITAFMTGTECLDVHRDVVEAYLAGDIDRALRLYHTTMLAYLPLFNEKWHYYLNYMLMRRGVLDSVVLPFPNSDGTPAPEQTAELDWALDRINDLRGSKIL